MNRRPLIIDCDPGTDDAIAILMMLGCPDFDVIGICPVNGNKPLEVTEKNALRLCEVAGRTDIPVLRGAPKGLLVPLRTAGDIHGSNGFGGVELPEPLKKTEDEYAWDFIHRKAVELGGGLEIMAIGPLTNIAVALLKYPDLPRLIRKITVMGGAFSGGNMTPAAEFNIWVDPHGAKIVFDSGIDIAMMGLDICMTAYMTAEELERIVPGCPATDFARKVISQSVEFAAQYGGEGAVMCDATAAFHLIDPEGMETERVHIDVETRGTLTEGATIATRDFTEHVVCVPNAVSGIRVDRKRFTDAVVRCLNALNG